LKKIVKSSGPILSRELTSTCILNELLVSSLHAALGGPQIPVMASGGWGLCSQTLTMLPTSTAKTLQFWQP